MQIGFYFLLNHPEVIEISQDDYDAGSDFNVEDEIDVLNENIKIQENHITI